MTEYTIQVCTYACQILVKGQRPFVRTYIYTAVVKEQLGRQCYRVQWAEGTEQTQTILHMFGPPTVRRTLQAGDHVIALAMAGESLSHSIT